MISSISASFLNTPVRYPGGIETACAASCVENTASGETPALHRACNHQFFVRANDANRGPAGIHGNRPEVSALCDSFSI